MEQADFDSEKFGRLFVFLRLTVLLAICMALSAPVNASAATAGFGPVLPLGEPGDENWAAEVFGLPGVDAQVYALAVDQDRRVVCWRRLL